MAGRIEDYALIGDCETAALVDNRRLHRLALLARFLLRGMFCRAAGQRGEWLLAICACEGRMDAPRAAIATTR